MRDKRGDRKWQPISLYRDVSRGATKFIFNKSYLVRPLKSYEITNEFVSGTKPLCAQLTQCDRKNGKRMTCNGISLPFAAFVIYWFASFGVSFASEFHECEWPKCTGSVVVRWFDRTLISCAAAFTFNHFLRFEMVRCYVTTMYGETLHWFPYQSLICTLNILNWRIPHKMHSTEMVDVLTIDFFLFSSIWINSFLQLVRCTVEGKTAKWNN